MFGFFCFFLTLQLCGSSVLILCGPIWPNTSISLVSSSYVKKGNKKCILKLMKTSYKHQIRVDSFRIQRTPVVRILEAAFTFTEIIFFVANKS